MYYMLLIFLSVLYLEYLRRFRNSRNYQLLKKIPSLGVEFPIIGSVWKFAGSDKSFTKALTDCMHNVNELGGRGRMYMFTMYYVVITDAIDAAVALKSCVHKDYLYRFLRTFSGNGTAFSSDPIVKKHRKVMLPGFSTKFINSFLDVFWEESVMLADSLAMRANSGPFSVENYLHRYNLRIILRSGIDISNNEIYCEEFLKALCRWEELAKKRATNIFLHPDFLYRLSPLYREGKDIVKIFYRYAQKILDQRKEEIRSWNQTEREPGSRRGPKRGIFDVLIDADMEEQARIEEILILVFGTDLATFSLGFTLMLLGLYPDVQEKVYKELHDVFQGTDRSVTKEDINKLFYLEMVMKESMRLFPPASLITRAVLKDLELPSGNIVPAGNSIVLAIRGIHVNKKYWGENADCFEPERFSPERIRNVPSSAFIPFSCGPRSCIGYKYGETSMKVVISTILRKYRIVGKPAGGAVPSIDLKLHIFLKANNGFKIEIVRRQ